MQVHKKLIINSTNMGFLNNCFSEIQPVVMANRQNLYAFPWVFNVLSVCELEFT